MDYKQFGKTDLQVSKIAFGAGPLGNEYGGIDDDTATRAVHTAIDNGINIFDTAPYYGRTLSEKRLGKALVGKRDKVIIATKCGRYDLAGFDFTKERLLRSLEESLSYLQTDYIDLFQLHDIEFEHSKLILEESLPTLLRMKEEGKVRYIGITCYPVHLLRDIASQFTVDSVLSYCHYNLLNTTLNDVLVPLVKEQNLGLINASPLNMGILTDAGSQTWHPAPQIVHDTAQKAAKVAREAGVNISDLALQFALQNENVHTTLVGMKTEGEVEQNLAVLNAEMPTDLLEEIQAILEPVKNINWHSGLPEHYEPNAQPQRHRN